MCVSGERGEIGGGFVEKEYFCSPILNPIGFDNLLGLRDYYFFIPNKFPIPVWST